MPTEHQGLDRQQQRLDHPQDHGVDDANRVHGMKGYTPRRADVFRDNRIVVA